MVEFHDLARDVGFQCAVVVRKIGKRVGRHLANLSVGGPSSRTPILQPQPELRARLPELLICPRPVIAVAPTRWIESNKRTNRRSGGSMTAYAPPGWPDEVRPPDAPDWERQAVAYLLDLCPPDFRGERLFLRHPEVLAAFATECVRGQQRAAMDGLAAVRVELAEVVGPEVINQAVDIWQQEAARLVRVARAVDLLRRALVGERFVPRMGAPV
jgi:hypothetical protein